MAEGHAVERVNRASGEATRFLAILDQYQAAPEVTLVFILIGPFSFHFVFSFILVVITRYRNLLEEDRQKELAEQGQNSRREAARSAALLTQQPGILPYVVLLSDAPAGANRPVSTAEAPRQGPPGSGTPSSPGRGLARISAASDTGPDQRGVSAERPGAGSGHTSVARDGPIGGGMTQRTTAHLSNTIDDRYAQRTLRASGAEVTPLGTAPDPSPLEVSTGAVGEGVEGRLQVAGVHSILVPHEGKLKVDVITQKLAALVVPEQDRGIELFRLEEQQKTVGVPGVGCHAPITVHFLNAVLDRTPRISGVRFLNPYLDKEFEEDKLVRVTTECRVAK